MKRLAFVLALGSITAFAGAQTGLGELVEKRFHPLLVNISGRSFASQLSAQN